MDVKPEPDTITLNQVQTTCIRCRVVDSWQKLHILLWLYEHRDLRLTCEELAQRLFLGDVSMVKEMLGELRTAGFLVAQEGRCALSDSPDVQACLASLHQAFADPLARQELIARIREVSPPGRES